MHPQFITQTYTTTPSGHQVKMMVSIPKTGEKTLPVVIGFHGGGLATGARDSGYLPSAIESYISTHAILIQASYRFLTPSTGHSISSDTHSLLTHLLSPTFLSLFPPSSPQPDLHRILIIGCSGGAYPARLAAVHATEESKRPDGGRYNVTGLLSVIGMGGDFLLDKWVTPVQSIGIPNRRIPPSELYSTQIAHWEGVKQHYSPSTSEVSYDPYRSRWPLWSYWHATSTFLDALTGLSGLGIHLSTLPPTSRASAVPPTHRAVFPQIYLANPANARKFPKTFLIHGTDDQMVYKEESEMTYNQLREGGGRAELVLVKGAPHYAELGGRAEKARMLEFVKGCLKGR